MRRLLPACCAIAVACTTLPSPDRPALTSFEVTVLGVFQGTGGARVPLRVETTCATQYGGDALVPAAARGLPDCRYVIPRGEVELDIAVRALDKAGKLLADFNGPVSFRIVPGDLSGDYKNRWGQAVNGELNATVKALHQYGVARVWAEDAPPRLLYDGGAVGGTVGELPAEPPLRTYATGVSAELYFEDHTIASLQLPDGFDNRTSPFIGEFVTIGKTPESGEQLTQTCTDDPERDTRASLMVVTGLDPGGFFVTDLTACRLKEWTRDPVTGGLVVRTPELPEPCLAPGADGGLWPIETTDAGTGSCAVEQKSCSTRADCAGYMPGTFGSMYIYNYSFPDGLNEGDLLFTLSGAVQEFTSTSQLTFPAWSIAEKVRTLPPEQWNKWLQFAPPKEITGRTCGIDDAPEPFVTDIACGHNRRNLKMESLESSLVKVRNVRVPEVYVNCDFNADGQVPFFCEQTDQGAWVWGSCAFGEVEPESDRVERQCNQDCVLGAGAYAGKRCAEEATFIGFGQFPVVMNAPGPAFAGLDDSLPLRTQVFAVPLGVSTDGGSAGVSVRPPQGVPSGEEIVSTCDGPVHYRFGDLTVSATTADPLLPRATPLAHFLEAGFTQVAFLATEAGTTCHVSWNPRMHINLVLKDAIPGIQPDCQVDNPDAAKARQCKLFIEATYDVVGHLRHVQPARPRWEIFPRAAEDLCCHPGPEGECPRPIEPCP